MRVVDQDGHPMPNVAVTFLLPGNGPGGTFADGKNSLTVMTDENGRPWDKGYGRMATPDNSRSG